MTVWVLIAILCAGHDASSCHRWQSGGPDRVFDSAEECVPFAIEAAKHSTLAYGCIKERGV